MHIQPARRSSLFLMELLIAILFFSIAAAVCVRIFVKSYTLETQSRELDHAVNLSVSIGEIILYGKNKDLTDCKTLLKSEFPNGTFSDNVFYIYYDSNWEPCNESEISYTVQIKLSHDDFLIGDIKIYNNHRTIYTLTVENYTEDAL